MEGSVATPGQGAPPAAQPAATGQAPAGQGQPTADGKGGGSFNWGLFPNVPENQRELLQPHLTNVLGHVTKMEQQYAPYKGILDYVQPDQAQNLIQFLQNYSQDPLATWLGLGQSLHEEGAISNPNFSMDELQALINAQGPAFDAQGMESQEDMPPWAQQMMQTLSGIEAREQQRQAEEQQRQAAEEERTQEALLTEVKSTIREQLKASGIPDDLVSDEQIVAQLIVHKGDVNAATQAFTGLRDGFLKGFTQQNGSGPQQPRINGEVPQAPRRGGLRSRPGDELRSASIGAEQFLRQAAAGGQE